MNTLYYGDNLEVLGLHLKNESVDLIYLDPPFNSNQDYNVLFREKDGSASKSQIKAFGDTWSWDQESAHAFQTVVEAGGPVSSVLQSFRTFLGDNDMLAYLSMMAPRLKELHRVLKATGSIFLHCDPTASHYLKLLMDAVFGLVVSVKRWMCSGLVRPIQNGSTIRLKSRLVCWTGLSAAPARRGALFWIPSAVAELP